MTKKRTPPEGLLPEDKRLWIENHKNRNRHSVKFPDDLEADFQTWKAWFNHNDNSALVHLVRTHPDLKTPPTHSN